MKYINDLIENFRLKSQAKGEFLLIINEFRDSSLSLKYKNTTSQLLIDKIENFIKNYKDYHDIDKYYKTVFSDNIALFKGKTLLTAACLYAPQYIDVLLKNGANVNKKDGMGLSPIRNLFIFNDNAEDYTGKLFKYGLKIDDKDLDYIKSKTNIDCFLKIIESLDENEKFKNIYAEKLDNSKKRRPVL